MKKFHFYAFWHEPIVQWPQAIKYSLPMLLSFLMFGIGYGLILQKDIERYKAKQAQFKALKSQLAARQLQASQLVAYQGQLQRLNKRLEKMRLLWPDTNEMPALLDKISKTGLESGLIFEKFAPQPEKTHDFYIEFPIQMTVVGGYHKLALFLSHIAEMKPMVTLHDIEIKTEEADPWNKTKAKDDVLSMKVLAKIYRYSSV